MNQIIIVFNDCIKSALAYLWPMERITESESNYNNLEQMNVVEILENINKEDKTVAVAIESCIPQIETFVNRLFEKIH